MGVLHEYTFPDGLRVGRWGRDPVDSRRPRDRDGAAAVVFERSPTTATSAKGDAARRPQVFCEKLERGRHPVFRSSETRTTPEKVPGQERRHARDTTDMED